MLLANNGTLPLASGPRIALIGPSADNPRTFLGCYSFPNHVLSRHADDSTGVDVPTLKQSLNLVLDGDINYQ